MIDPDYSQLTLDFKNPAASKALTSALLLHDFKLKVTLPSNDLFLCPPVPNRVNYICWISDLIDTVQASRSSSNAENSTLEPIIAADLGTGPIAIYPLLGVSLFKMHFIGSEVNEQAFLHATETVSANHLNDQIELFLVSDSNEYQSLILQYLSSNASENLVRPRKLESVVVDDAGGVRRGPLLSLLIKWKQSEIEKCEQQYLASLTDSKKSNPVGDASQSREEDSGPLLEAVMTNPPFYTLDEEVRLDH